MGVRREVHPESAVGASLLAEVDTWLGIMGHLGLAVRLLKSSTWWA